MQKLRNEVVNKILRAHLSKAEIDVLLEISHYQDENGTAYGVHYRDVCNAVGISVDTFYWALHGLCEKNLITAKKAAYGDWDIEIIGNNFVGKKPLGYVSTGHDIFFNKEFLKLKANEKLIALFLIMSVGADGKKTYHKDLGDFYQFFCEALDIKKLTLSRYLHRLKAFFNIRYDKNIILIKPGSDVEKWQAPKDNEILAEHIMKVAVRRNKATSSSEILKETAALIGQYARICREKSKNICAVFLSAVQKSFEQINSAIRKRSEWNRQFQPALINSLISKATA